MTGGGALEAIVMVVKHPQLEDVLQRVSTWPAEVRLALARRVLETLETEPSPSKPSRGVPLEQVLGLWSTADPPPTDEECDRILAEELQRKHAS
jgi:hypothetical protein